MNVFHSAHESSDEITSTNLTVPPDKWPHCMQVSIANIPREARERLCYDTFVGTIVFVSFSCSRMILKRTRSAHFSTSGPTLYHPAANLHIHSAANRSGRRGGGFTIHKMKMPNSTFTYRSDIQTASCTACVQSAHRLFLMLPCWGQL